MINPKLAMGVAMTRANAINQVAGAARIAGLGAAGLGAGALALNLFAGNDQQAQAPQQSYTPSAVPAGASQSIPQAVPGMELVQPLNQDQISKAQKRAQEQAALNAFYAQSLANYGVQN